MKPVLLLFLSASLCAAQSNAVNGKGGGVTDAAAFRTALSLASATGIHSTNGPVVAVNSGASTLSWAGVMAQMSVEASAAKHALIARSPSGAANGIAVVGWSSSGAAAAKFYQDTDYTSATLYAIRAATSSLSPVVVISATSGTGSHPAIQILAPGTSTVVFAVTHDGAVTSLYQRYGTGVPVLSAPVGAIYHRTDAGAGQPALYVRESSGWVAK
jgi:hypothetical protein